MQHILVDRLGLPAAVGSGTIVILTLVAAVAIALILHKVMMSTIRRIAMRTPNKVDEVLVGRIDGPARWIFVMVALTFSQRGIDLPDWAAALWQQTAGLIVPALIGWLAIAIINAMSDIGSLRNDISIADNLRARRQRTRIAILTRILIFVVVFLTLCMMLLSIPAIRNVGVTLIASAGLAGLAVGAAAQPALKNIVAGIQLAFTEPVRIDDVVIMDGEWGRIEEIRLTYIVIRIWDDRRLIVPVSKFLKESFQNWTRSTSQLLGSVFVHVDPAADVPRIRAKAEEVIAANPRWDKRFWNLQVTESRPDSLELRILVTAADATIAFDLRCDIREALVGFLAREMPEAMVRHRLVSEPVAGSAARNEDSTSPGRTGPPDQRPL